MATELPALTPQAILALTALAVFAVDAIWPDTRRSDLLAAISIAGTLLAGAIGTWFLLASTGQPPGGQLTAFAGALVVDGATLVPALVVYFATTLLSVGILLYNVNELVQRSVAQQIASEP